MQWVKDFLFIVGFALYATVPPLAAVSGISFVSGSPADVNSIAITGSEFTCEWVSEDRTSAVFNSNFGLRRLVEFDRPTNVKVGRSYHIERSRPTHKFGGSRAYLVAN